MANDIIQFQAGRLAAMAGEKRDKRRSADYLEGFDMESPKPVQPDFLKDDAA